MVTIINIYFTNEGLFGKVFVVVFLKVKKLINPT